MESTPNDLLQERSFQAFPPDEIVGLCTRENIVVMNSITTGI